MQRGPGLNLAYFVFDLPYLNGFDLRRCRLDERKALLGRLLEGRTGGPLRYSEHIGGRGSEALASACRMALEGVVSKRADSVYIGRRSGSWVKTRCDGRQEVVIGGFTPPAGKRTGFGALLTGVFDENGRLVHTGKIGTGYDDRTLGDLRARLRPLETRESPFDRVPPGAKRRGVTWVRPLLVAEAEFTQWTEDGRMRHPEFVGLREDKSALEVARERANEAPDGTGTNGRAGRRASTARPRAGRAAPRWANSLDAKGAAESEVAGMRLTHPDRVLYPGEGVTKADLARYYEAVAEWALPHIAGRPLTLVRCPQGRSGKCFYLRSSREATAVAAYSTRAREGAPVSTPLAWKELTPGLDSASLNTRTVPARLKRLRSGPWKGFFESRQALPEVDAPARRGR